VAHTLLLADDSVTIQRVIELTFADEDIKVVAVSDGDQAIERIEAEPPDIVLADVGMPGRTGYDVARHIKESPRLSHIPVLLLTGAFEPVDQDMAARAGCDGVLAKPFEPQLVIARVNELLGGNGQALPRPAQSAAAVDAPRVRPGAAPSPPAAGQLDTYFDRLDQAFANMNSGNEAASDLPLGAGPLSEAPSARALELNAASAGAADSADRTRSAEHVPPDRASPAVAPPSSSAPAPLPSLGDAFAAILAAEQTRDAAGSAPASDPPALPTDATIDTIVARVLERLADVVSPDTVTDIVTKTADRLVREEIERIKAAVK
jgi:CheY-like chemotaxis protein